LVSLDSFLSGELLRYFFFSFPPLTNSTVQISAKKGGSKAAVLAIGQSSGMSTKEIQRR
jgi:hypothetical protein